MGKLLCCLSLSQHTEGFLISPKLAQAPGKTEFCHPKERTKWFPRERCQFAVPPKVESLFFCQIPAKPLAWGHQVFPFSRWQAHWTPANDNKQQTVGIFFIASTRLYVVGKYYYDWVGGIRAHGRVVGSRWSLSSLPTWAIW